MTATVVLLATSIVYRSRFVDTPYIEHPFPSDVETVMAADELAEFAARSCDQSWQPDRPTNHEYLRRMIVQEDYSALEHASATFWIVGISRSLASELTKHSGLAYSQLSQRHADPIFFGYVMPPAYRDSREATEAVEDISDDAADAYGFLVGHGVANGLSLQEAKDAARCVLPNCTETTLVVTGNMRTWRDVIDKHNRPSADAEIRELTQEILRRLKEVAPNSFQDMNIRTSRISEEVWNAANPPLSIGVASPPLSPVSERAA